ncbi:antirepressor [Cupriavidus sp. SK-3]|nr:antirepressor [Cupriavidus sp. SK-3]
MGQGATLTMSSREIAELVDSRHDKVKQSIERLASRGVITLPPMGEVSNDGPGPKTIAEYRVSKRDSYVIVAQLSPEFTARLVDRWQELEARSAAPALPNFSDPIAAARAWADVKEAEQKALVLLEEQRPAVEFMGRYVEASGSMGFREVCKLLRANEREFKQFLLDEDVMYPLSGRLAPCSPHLHAGRFEVKTGVAANEHAYTQARFTPKGIAWVAGLWFERQAAGAVV